MRPINFSIVGPGIRVQPLISLVILILGNNDSTFATRVRDELN